MMLTYQRSSNAACYAACHNLHCWPFMTSLIGRHELF